MSWTDDRVATLKKLWGEGKTAAEIAKELGGVTRNAVIGKAHRLKLSNRVSPIQQNKKSAKPVKAPEKKIKKKIVAEQNNQAVDLDRDLVALMDLNNSMCRWPIGDPRDKNFGFCGCENIPGLPYCSDHSKVAYQAATRNRILQAEKERELVAQAQAKAATKKVASK